MNTRRPGLRAHCSSKILTMERSAKVSPRMAASGNSSSQVTISMC